ncbi:hypothetical protein [Chitinimonas lacunae]|uniref:Uncharacterized protein n=1 Tax=Chitinimonas lacunae TaxID=1963018 RepID=A0ABV8MNF1_9NEIS
MASRPLPRGRGVLLLSQLVIVFGLATLTGLVLWLLPSAWPDTETPGQLQRPVRVVR